MLCAARLDSTPAGAGLVAVELDDGFTVRVAAAESLPVAALIGPSGGAGDLTGCMLWPGAAAMATFVRQELPGAGAPGLVVELGCGSGLVAATVAASGLARHVIATDASDAALDRCRATCHANPGAPDMVEVLRVPWDDAACVDALVASTRARLGAGDWPLTVLGAEIVYPSTTLPTLQALFALTRRLAEAHTSGAEVRGAPAAGVLRHQPSFWMAYVERQPATTLRMFVAAWQAGYRHPVCYARLPGQPRWVPGPAASAGAAGDATGLDSAAISARVAAHPDEALAAGAPIVIDWGQAHALDDGAVDGTSGDAAAAVAELLPGLSARIARVEAAVAEAAAEAAEWVPPFADA